MKKLLLAVLFAPLMAFAQTFTYPSVTFQNLTVLGTCVGCAGTLGPQPANTVLANATASSAAPLPFSMPGCSAATNALTWTTSTGFTCNSSINAATLGGATFAAPGPIGSTTASTGAFSTLSASTSLTAPTLAAGTNTTGVATTAFVAKHAPCPSILDNGGDNTGVSDNYTAFFTTAALGPSGKACVYFPPGTYAFSAQAAYTMPSNTASITILGAGQDITNLVWAGGGGLTINFITDANSVHIRDLSIETGAANVGYGIFLNQTAANTSFSTNVIMSDVSNVTLRGNDGYQVSNYWNSGIQDFGISNINFVGIDIAGRSALGGTGIEVSGDANRTPVQINIYGCVFSGLSYGFYYGPYTQGVSIATSNFTNVTRGVYASGSALDQLTITGSQFNATTIDIDLESPLLQTMIYGNLILLQSSANGIYLNPSSSTSIVGNSFAPNPGATGTNGITFNSFNALSSVVTGNNFAQLTTGINLTSGARNVNVQSNAYSGNTNNVVNNCGATCTVGGGSP